MNPLTIKLAVYAAAFTLAFTSGWMVHGWKYEASQLATEKERNDAYIKSVEAANKTSAELDGVLATLQANKFVTVKELRHETTKQTYTDCKLPDAGRVLFNKSAEPANPR